MSKFEPSSLICRLLDEVHASGVDPSDLAAVEAELRRQIRSATPDPTGTAFELSEAVVWLGDLARALAEVEEAK